MTSAWLFDQICVVDDVPFPSRCPVHVHSFSRANLFGLVALPHTPFASLRADDFGLVKLFNYPCVVDDAPHRAYRGHSSHVMCVRFNCADSRVVSVGGHDCAMFQFKFVKLEPPPVPEPEPEPVWGPTDATGGHAAVSQGRV